MRSQRAILAGGSRLLRELIRSAIEKKSGLEIVREFDDHRDLPFAIAETEPEYVFVIAQPEQEISKGLKDELFSRKADLKIVGLWVDGSHIRLEWLAHEQKDFTGSTMEELTRFLREELQSMGDENSSDQ